MKSSRKRCPRCNARLNRLQEVCPNCRERQPVLKTWKYWIVLALAFAIWWAFH